MDIELGLALAVFLVGFIILCINKRWADLAHIACLAGLIAVLLTFGGYVHLAAGHH
jgi:hypothetical protein